MNSNYINTNPLLSLHSVKLSSVSKDFVNFVFSKEKMGKKDKHNPGQSRNASVFKVATNGKFSKQKGKPKEVSLKLKKVLDILILLEEFFFDRTASLCVSAPVHEILSE